MAIQIERIAVILRNAREHGRQALLETEGLAVLELMGIPVPQYLFVKTAQEVSLLDLSVFRGERIVVKVISPFILHKSDVGGVAIIPKTREAVCSTLQVMESRFAGRSVVGFTLNEFIPYDTALGSELLVGARWTEDFGPVLTFGPGGIYTEFLTKNFRPGKDVAIVSPEILDPENLREQLQSPAITQLITGTMRGQRPRLRLNQISTVIEKFGELVRAFMPGEIAECEINPLVITEDELMALDILIKLGEREARVPPPRPVHKLKNLLQPRSVAIIGVSEKPNPGHIILKNLLREGFPKDQISIVKPGAQTIEGCHCYPSIGALPGRVDLFILSIDAAQAPGVLMEIVEARKAESVILIPGGLEEKLGAEAIVVRLREALAKARQSDWEGPVINGGNCLGITSRAGHYDTMFIPEYKLPVPGIPVSPVAFISQSGAFAVAKASKLASVNPKYSITVGNQMDLTVGDYLSHLKDDPEIRVFAVYVEGFQPLDGLKFLKAAREITFSGRVVVFYRAGRTSAGAQAAASHTASIAGDYTVTRQLAGSVGVVLAENIAEFEDLTRLFTFLRDKDVDGLHLGAVSNAGFECVSIADNLGQLELARFHERTDDRLRQVFREARIDQVVDVHNPIDLTPMTGDAAFADAVEIVLDDPQVNVGIVSCVPLTAALNTLPAGTGHHNDIHREDSIVSRLIRLKDKSGKPWVAVVDSGTLYDPMVQSLEAGGIPTFRTVDRALALLNVLCREKISHRTRQSELLGAMS